MQMSRQLFIDQLFGNGVNWLLLAIGLATVGNNLPLWDLIDPLFWLLVDGDWQLLDIGYFVLLSVLVGLLVARQRQQVAFAAPLLWAWIPFAVWAVASTSWSRFPLYSLREWSADVLLPAALLPMGILFAQHARFEFRAVLNTLAVVLIGVLALVVGQEFTLPNRHLDTVLFSNWLIYLVPWICFWMARGSAVEQRQGMLLLLLVFAFAWCLGLRAYWLTATMIFVATLAGTHVFSLQSPAAIPLRRYLWVALLISVAGVVFSSAAKPPSWIPGADEGNYLAVMVTRSDRWLIFSHWLEQSTQNLWTGVGLGWELPGLYYRKAIPEGMPEIFFSHGHNFFINLLLQLGVVGLVLFAGILLAAVSLLLPRLFAADPEIRRAAFFCLLLIAVLVVKNTPDDGMRDGNIPLFWFLLGSLLGRAHSSGSPHVCAERG